MKRIKALSIQNFKAFQNKEVFDFGKEGKNVLVYGNNGSGKSSFFWALYTLLQSSTKADDGIKKYFAKYVASNPDTHQTLKNVFMDEEEDSFIKVTSIDTETSKEETYTISHDVINTNKDEDTIIQELNLASDFINYKLLHNFYRGSHKKEVNLWPVFERDIFPYFTDDANKPFIEKWYSYFDKVHDKDGRTIGKRTHERKSIDSNIEKFDKELKKFISETQDNANSFLKEHFLNGEETIRITLDPRATFSLKRIRNKLWKNEKWRKGAHQIILKVEVRKSDGEYKLIERPHSFLNESLLTRIAISIRIGALRTRPLKEAKFKSLVLDDMLISLDLSNRMDVVRIILNKEGKASLKFFDGFQKFILTHDKGFFNLIRRNTDEEEWVYYNFNKDESDNLPPKIKPDYTSLQQAVRYFEEDEFENCGNELRKEAEAILTSYLDPEMKKLNKEFEGLSSKLDKAFNTLTNERLQKFKQSFNPEIELEKLKKIKTDFQVDGTLSEEDKTKLEALKTRLFDFLIEFNEKKNQKELLIKDVKEILDRVMNSASHHDENPLYRAELKEAIEKLKDLKNEFE
jgi:energy-coupling factor transporter ATP-binding protein EcfA2